MLSFFLTYAGQLENAVNIDSQDLYLPVSFEISWKSQLVPEIKDLEEGLRNISVHEYKRIQKTREFKIQKNSEYKIIQNTREFIIKDNSENKIIRKTWEFRKQENSRNKRIKKNKRI